ncbi:PAS domain-containing sensor histidine kinase [Maridesulfovibrio ferrireducens]|uniref:sensor histidine kinase n=1 Tax=Maridesulfovibrio ferrireducens TaxID=246191 RepID=UPI001A27FFF9|nr:ATP-binding protein [Maridesulfovibrio ferrireducens]MBI9111393.1 PAS domain S-box protein [Maridesulfovibrio ferrireducens]
MSSLQKMVIENILASLSVGLMVISQKGKIIFLNNSACEILGLNIEEHLGCGWGELFITDDTHNIEFNQVIIDAITEQGVGRKHSVAFSIKKEKCTKKLSITSSFLTDEGKTLGMVFLFEDVTDFYQAEERERQMLSRNVELQKERIAGLDSLAQAVAHQVLNPTIVIGGLANLISKKLPKDDPLNREIKAISEEAEKLEGLVTAVKNYSTIPKANPSEVKIELLIKQAIEKTNEILSEIGENINVKLENNIPFLNVDRDLFLSAIVELLLNASNFTPELSTDVAIKIFKKGDVISIKIIDHGLGIESRYLPYVLDPFYSTKAKGVGMGLSLVKKIVFEHQGKLFIESEGKNKGTIVTIDLPCSNNDCCSEND